MDTAETLSKFIQKILLYWGKREITCRVHPPAAGIRSYSITLEGDHVREQILLDAKRAEQYVQSGNEQHVLTEVRAAIRNLERQKLKRKAARRGTT